MNYFESTTLYQVVSAIFIVAICIAVYGIKTEIKTMVKMLESIVGFINAQSGNKSSEDELRTITADWKLQKMWCKRKIQLPILWKMRRKVLTHNF